MHMCKMMDACGASLIAHTQLEKFNYVKIILGGVSLPGWCCFCLIKQSEKIQWHWSKYEILKDFLLNGSRIF